MYCFLRKGTSSQLTRAPCSGCVTLQIASLSSLAPVWGWDNVTYIGFWIRFFSQFILSAYIWFVPMLSTFHEQGQSFIKIDLQYAYVDESFPATWPELPSITPYNSSNPIWSSLFIHSPKLPLHSPLLSPPPPPHILLENGNSYNYRKPEKFLCGIWWGRGHLCYCQSPVSLQNSDLLCFSPTGTT